MASSEGRDTKVAVKVIDERPSKSLGRRSAGLYGDAAEIKSEQDLAVVIADQVRAGLEKMGFIATDLKDTAISNLTIEVRLLEYSTSTGFWTGGVQAQGALKAIARNNNDTYDKMYRYNNEERILMTPTAEANEKLINKALGKVLQQLLDDEELIRTLKG